jgi:uncharacterized membrane protein
MSTAMPDTVEAVTLAVLILATSIWVGGYVAIAVVARTATATLNPADRVAFFRALGRTYLRVGLTALVVALATGAVLLRGHDWDALLSVTAAVAAVLVASLAVAVVQARRMTALRRELLSSPDDATVAARVRHGARAAAMLRGVLGLLSVTLVILGAFLAT